MTLNDCGNHTSLCGSKYGHLVCHLTLQPQPHLFVHLEALALVSCMPLRGMHNSQTLSYLHAEPLSPVCTQPSASMASLVFFSSTTSCLSKGDKGHKCRS